MSKISSGSLPNMPIDNMDPDELFVKHNISEIKIIQQRLRADADAKQEELRLMVGYVEPKLFTVSIIQDVK
ncbi:hypothetical protein J3R30DRAFT_3283683 [Lentinula aciculospora]|uniref:Uncharacterized protein n=1 Tax=Lentinula aciculospora TaxID=153920 RepID=A0A9W9DTW5_9AGAR|nr:hypothetical protein J3R30DRAFT_3283683 [Lentinula aciculospora]